MFLGNNLHSIFVILQALLYANAHYHFKTQFQSHYFLVKIFWWFFIFSLNKASILYSIIYKFCLLGCNLGQHYGRSISYSIFNSLLCFGLKTGLSLWLRKLFSLLLLYSSNNFKAQLTFQWKFYWPTQHFFPIIGRLFNPFSVFS